MTDDGWLHTLGRHNPYAGARELELREALNANPYSIIDAKDAWLTGADDLHDLAVGLGGQKDRIREVYEGAGEDAALVYERMESMVLKREKEMRAVATALEESHKAVEAARAAYYKLPAVRPPSDGSLPPALDAGATKAQKEKHAEKVKARKAENATADANHESDKKAAEAKAVEALAVLDTSLNGSADKMRGVAGMEKPTGGTSTGHGQPVGHALPRSKSPTGPGVISAPDIDANPTDTSTPPTTVNPGHPDPGTPGPVITRDPPNDTTSPLHPLPKGVLAGPPVGTEGTHPPSVPSSLGSSSPFTSSTATGVGVSAVTPTGLAASAIRRGGSPGVAPSVPGATLGRSSTSAASVGSTGRNAMMPGQTAARTTGAGVRGAAGGRGGRMVPGQGGARARGSAGSRGAMASGTGAGRRKGGKDEQDRIDLLWDDGDDWLGDDETAPQTLGRSDLDPS